MSEGGSGARKVASSADDDDATGREVSAAVPGDATFKEATVEGAGGTGQGTEVAATEGEAWGLRFPCSPLKDSIHITFLEVGG